MTAGASSSETAPSSTLPLDAEPPAQAAARRPNILLVLLDDAGFMDFGAYGSDTATPRIDALAGSGALFTRYYTQPQCGPSRASLMTGQDNHLVGAGSLNEALSPAMRDLPAYSMTWSDDQATIASRLREAGYQTFVSGKWGIGKAGVNLPHRFGFDRSWVLDATGSSNYEAKPYLPLYLESKWFEDGERVSLPEDFYSSRDIVDRMIRYVDEADPDRPFFAFVSFQALHMPVQVQRAYIDKYDGVFDRGWDVLRQERLQRAIELGLVPEGTRLAEPPADARRWDDLSEREKAYWARAMQVNAGMMEAADAHLGRLLDHLDASGQLDDTLVLVTSDNGPEYNTLGKTSGMPAIALEKVWMAIEGWDVDVDNLGQPGNLAAIGAEWASVSAAPLHLFKFNASEGGLRVPMIVRGPGVQGRGLVDSRAQVSDIAPTLLDAAGVAYDPADFYGRSLMPVLAGQADGVYGREDSFAFEVCGAAALYRGDWKITRTPPPFGDGQWRLFDIARDPGEVEDLSAQQPELFASMQAEYEAYADEVGVYEFAPGETARDLIVTNAFKKFARNYWYVVAGLVGVLTLAGYLVFRILKLIVGLLGRRSGVAQGV